MIDYDLLFYPKSKDSPGPLRRGDIEHAEHELGIAFPESYIDFLKHRNGGDLRYNGIYPIERPFPRHTDRPVYEIFGIAGVHRTHTNSVLAMMENAKLWEIADGLIPFAGVGEWWLCFDYRRANRNGAPRIVHVDVESRGEFLVARSFDELLRGLFRSDWDYYIALIDSKLTYARLDKTMNSLGYVQSMEGLEGAWTSRRYLASSGAEVPATILLEQNHSAKMGRSFPQIAKNARLLRVTVSTKHQQKCISELLVSLGNSVVLVHQAPDRKPIKLPAIPAKRTR